MGRSTPTAGVIYQQERSALKSYRQSLPKEYQRAFDDLWRYGSLYLMPCSCADHPMPFYIFLLSMILEQRKQLDALG